MAYKLRKDETKLVAKWKVKSSALPYYFHVFLWEDRESYLQNTVGSERSLGCVNLAPWLELNAGASFRKHVRPKLGEIHFIKDVWNMNIVAHELCHAIIHRIRTIGPSMSDVVNQVGGSEEEVCYEFGRWMDCLYRSLWDVNPPITKEVQS